MTWQLRLDVFEGPLDLLLHLIQEQELDIHDIPIAEVAEQYLEFVAHLSEVDLDRAGEFLVMAATLLELKARMLLPRLPGSKAEPVAAEAGEAPDPREELVRRLLEYSRFKQAAGRLEDLEAARALTFPRWVEPQTGPPALPEGGLDARALWTIFSEVLRRGEPEPVREIPRDRLTVRQLLGEVVRRLQSAAGGLGFRALLGSRPSRLEVVVTFLAVLELLRAQRVRVVQGGPRDEIKIIWREEAAG